ncbi:hypothetical protein [Streptomyces sp. DH24]|nr:hypothetical protein [Streptomyces sp. DH24]MDG9719617.1 hypothetical protein [Streptomyces sp. DH24]
MRVPQKVIAAVMAFGAGVMLSAVSFELPESAVIGVSLLASFAPSHA